MPSTIHRLLKVTVYDIDKEACVKRNCESCGVRAIDKLVMVVKEIVDVYQWREGDNGYLNKLRDMMTSETLKDTLKDQLDTLSLHMFTSNRHHTAISQMKKIEQR